MSSKKAGPVRAVIIGLGSTGFVFGVVAPWLPWGNLLPLWALLIFLAANGALVFIIVRDVQLTSRRHRYPVRWKAPRGARQDSRQPPEDYYLMVLGSGGHTKEMLMMMDDGFCDFGGLHRRYLISSGDTMSLNHVEDYEADLRQLCDSNGCDPGSYDVRFVTRARRVHQSLLTTPLTALASLYDIVFNVLLSPPSNRVGQKLRYPRMIFSNGPATGFFVGLAVNYLKVFYVIPEDRCFFVYIESWARISSLSLTGKLIYYTGIADAFAVQHEQVASTYGVHNAGPMVFNSRRSDDTETNGPKPRG